MSANVRKLYQVLANVNSTKKKESDEITRLHRVAGHRGLFDGQNRSYRPLNDDPSEVMPDEVTAVQQVGQNILDEAQAAFVRIMDAEALRDYTNCSPAARADVVIDGRVILEQVPAIYCLALEKQLTDLRTFVAKLPVLDPAFVWRLDENTGIYRTEVTQQNRTRKVLRNHVKAEATDKFPAQVETYSEDIRVGTWETVKFSTAFPSRTIARLTGRIDQAIQAVRIARETANGADVVEADIGVPLMAWLFNA